MGLKMNGKITHVVVMVSYNQKKYISEAIDSIVNNKILPDEIIIKDDHSTDGTWEIISSYARRFPDIIKAVRNPQNIGLYQNINSAWKLGIESGYDIISWCSGDDFWAKGVIEKLNQYIYNNNIDYLHDSFIIVTNSGIQLPDGTRKIWNNYRLRDQNMKLQRLGKKLSYREVGISRNVFKNGFKPLRDDLGYASDLMFTLDIEGGAQKWFFANFVASYYRVNVGCTSAEKTQNILLSESEVYNEIITCGRYRLNDREMNVACLWKCFDELACYPDFAHWKSYIKVLLNSIKSNRQFITRRMVAFVCPPPVIRIALFLRQKYKNFNMYQRKSRNQDYTNSRS